MHFVWVHSFMETPISGLVLSFLPGTKGFFPSLGENAVTAEFVGDTQEVVRSCAMPTVTSKSSWMLFFVKKIIGPENSTC